MAFEIFASNHMWVITLTFQGQVTSLVTWPFDTPDAIFYKWSIVPRLYLVPFFR